MTDTVATDTLFTDALAALLVDHCPPAAVRAIESAVESTVSAAEGSAAPPPWLPLWRALADAGFADALVPEGEGGAGLTLAQVAPLWALCGAHTLPLPLAETLLARAALARAGLPAPDGPIALARVHALPDGRWRASAVPGARCAVAVLASEGRSCRLLAVADAQAEAAAFELDATLTWPNATWQAAPVLDLPALPDLRQWQALVLAQQLAGALGAVFERTLAHANERQQFGRAIGKFQAIQHQLSVMAEEVFAARMAAQIGCWADAAGDALTPDPLRVATAKARCSEAALQVAGLAHAIHGAIGFTREFDLQLYTRRLHAWRQAAGSESHWQRMLGEALVAGSQAPLLHTLQRIGDHPQAA